MKKIHDAQQLSAYIDTFSLQNYLDAALSDMAVLHSFDKDERLIQTGTVSDYLYFLVEGTVMVYSYPSDTQNIFIDYAKPATLLGEASSLWGIIAKSSVKAVTPCICVCISLNRYRSVLQQDVRFCRTFANSSAHGSIRGST